VWEFFPKILSALPVTLLIVGIATLVGLVLGSFIAFIRVEKIPILNQIAAVFVSFIRGTPILVQLYIVYYGVPSLLQVIQMDVSSCEYCKCIEPPVRRNEPLNARNRASYCEQESRPTIFIYRTNLLYNEVACLRA
jgi:His/Glu/Gln/Arg/opine family amino acid ABC transporter permease subunit